jgi:hypothetical protein
MEFFAAVRVGVFIALLRENVSSFQFLFKGAVVGRTEVVSLTRAERSVCYTKKITTTFLGTFVSHTNN